MRREIRQGDRVIATEDIGTRLWKFVPKGSCGVVAEAGPGRDPLIQFTIQEDLIDRLFPQVVELTARPGQVALLIS